MTADQLTLLRLIVDRFDGSVIGSPVQVVHDGRALAAELGAADWRQLGWPATGTGLVKLLDRSADELAGAGLLAHHTPEAPGQPEWLAVSDATAKLRDDHYLPSADRAHPLTNKLAAVLRHLTADGDWTGSLNELRNAWKALSSQQREALAGPPWPSTSDKLTTAVRQSRRELARRGIAVTHDGTRVAVTVAPVTEAAE